MAAGCHFSFFSFLFAPRIGRLARASLRQCRFCLMQFVLLKPLVALVPYVVKASGVNYDAREAFKVGCEPTMKTPCSASEGFKQLTFLFLVGPFWGQLN